MFVTGPDVIKTVTHEEVTKEELGGAMTHNSKSGVATSRPRTTRTACLLDPRAAQYLPQNNLERSRRRRPTDDPLDREDPELDDLVPADPNKPYDITT
jgi:propionyl-CoA carboxylase beta chain